VTQFLIVHKAIAIGMAFYIIESQLTSRTSNLAIAIIENNMNKAAIVEAVQQHLGGTRVQAEQIVDLVIDSIVNTLKKGDEVSIAGLGIFSAKQRAARTARNPRTGEMVQVAAMRVPKFRAAKAFKEAVR
jgi:DNA-binding protein HU-beta